jgi:hypothetical protein
MAFCLNVALFADGFMVFTELTLITNNMPTTRKIRSMVSFPCPPSGRRHIFILFFVIIIIIIFNRNFLLILSRWINLIVLNFCN